MRHLLTTMVIYCLAPYWGFSQKVTATPPTIIDPAGLYVFYLHGAIVQEKGPYAVSEYYGAYEYFPILSALSNYGYHVISEVRPRGTVELAYAEKLSKEIQQLLSSGVPPQNITVVGASMGAYITLDLAHLLQQQQINYALLGLCSDYAINYFSSFKDRLCGNFLSIYEASDSKGSCKKILDSPACKKGYQEIKLNMGIDHAFLYKPYKEWLIPLTEWINKSAKD